MFDQCRQWLGPNQPGINQPDPTAAATPAAAALGRRRPSSRPPGGEPVLDYLLGPVRGRRGALSASPLLVGAVTVLVALVAVFISYSANEGLPFVPDLPASRPSCRTRRSSWRATTCARGASASARSRTSEARGGAWTGASARSP